jgi:hypothetical protein
MTQTDSTTKTPADADEFLLEQLKSRIAEAGEALNVVRPTSENIQLRSPSTVPGKQYAWTHPLSYILSRSYDSYYLTFYGVLILMHYEAHEDGSDHHYATAVELDELVTSIPGKRAALRIINGLDHLIERIELIKQAEHL